MTPAPVKGRILFIPICTQGHVNYCITLAKRFLQLYSEIGEVYFAINDEYKTKLEKISKDVKYMVYEPANQKNEDKHWLIEMMEQFGATWSENPIEYIHKSAPVLETAFETFRSSYDILTNIVNEVKPDLIIFDQLFAFPIGVDQGIPYANLFSAAMSYVGLDSCPPPQSGLPTENTPENRKKWQEFVEKAYKTGPFKELRDKVSAHLKEKNCEGLESWFTFKVSPFLNIYGYPKDLDYIEDGIEFPGKWVRIESPILPPYPEPYPVPEKLKNLPGKLIYFSLGSMAAVYRPLMQKMLEVLAKLPHRFIVSTGLLGDQYVMADNMHGEKYVDQFAVLRTVDMIISHGGNNTLCETFTFGKPLVFVPLFGDQPDNAQRVQDKGLGRRCNIHAPVEKLKSDLEDAIEYCSKESVVLKMKKIGERIQKDSGIDKVCLELTKFFKK